MFFFQEWFGYVDSFYHGSLSKGLLLEPHRLQLMPGTGRFRGPFFLQKKGGPGRLSGRLCFSDNVLFFLIRFCSG